MCNILSFIDDCARKRIARIVSNMDFNLQFGPWALVTGASEGVGQAFAFELASRGLNVVLSSRKLDKLEALSTEIRQKYAVLTRVIPADLSEPGAVDILYVRCADLEIGLVVSNAGGTNLRSYMESGLAEVRQSIQLNVVAHADLARYFGEAMLNHRDGRGGLLFMSSIVGLQGTPYMSSYSASKAFLINFAEALHYENRQKGLHVTAVAPGPVTSSMLKIVPQAEEVFKDYQLSILEPETVVNGALAALEQNKAIYIPGRYMRLRYGLWRQYFHSRSANVSRWGVIVQRYMKALIPAPFLKVKPK